MANWIGYAASCAVLATFLMRTMVPLRLVAILSNVLFLSYGYIAHIYPVLFLHMALLPINARRLLVDANSGAGGRIGRKLFVIRRMLLRRDGLSRGLWLVFSGLSAFAIAGLVIRC